MKKINLAVMVAREREYPGCIDLLEDCPEFRIVANLTGLYEPASLAALAGSDVLVLDDATLEESGQELIIAIFEQYPALKILLVVDNASKEQMLDLLMLGITGIMERITLRSMLRRAIPVLYGGDSWISRELVHALRTRQELEMPVSSGYFGLTLPVSRAKLN